MSAERIACAALERFAVQGYDATALSEIAGDVGIRTPSIYAHFHSKRALFRHLLEDAFQRELACLEEMLLSDISARTAMHRYLNETLARFDVDSYLRFWLRAVYLPPPKMIDEISGYDGKFAASLEKTIYDMLRHPQYGVQNSSLSYETLASAFIGILRGVHAELLYRGQQNSQRIATALWTVFDISLQNIG